MHTHNIHCLVLVVWYTPRTHCVRFQFISQFHCNYSTMAAILFNPSILKATRSLYLNDEMSDVNFIFNIDGEIERVPVHKLILSAKSSVFKAMFFGALKEQNDVEIVDADIRAFKEFLQLFYLSNVALRMDCMETVLRLADKYDVMNCVHEMCATLSEKPLVSTNVFYIYQFAVYADYFPLIKKCEQLISNSSAELFQFHHFLRIDQNILACILEMGLKCDEIDLIYACLKWAYYACEKSNRNRRNGYDLRAELDDCLRLFRFCKLYSEQLTNLDATYEGLFTPDEFQDIIMMQNVPEYESKYFNRYDRRYDWNSDELLLCDRKQLSFMESIDSHRGPEVVSFTSNKPVLLGLIQMNAHLIDLNVSIEITESNTRSSNNTPRTIYRDIFKATNKHLQIISTYKPVLIKPQILYEVRVHMKKTPHKLIKYESVVELLHGIKIEFHRNMTLPYDNATSGCIASLGFNRITNYN